VGLPAAQTRLNELGVRDRFLWIGALVYAALLTLLGAIKYAGHHNLVDFGIFAQTAASAFGCFCNTIEGSHWAFHFSPILYVAGVAVWIVKSPLVLVALQSVACALVAPPVAALVAARAGRRAARLAALVVWLYPPLLGLAFGDFHENVFAPAAIVWTAWAFDSGRWRLTLLFALAAICTKEDQAVFLLVAGALGAWWFRGTTMGRTALFVASICVVVLVCFYVDIQPAAAAHAQWQPDRFYAWTAADARALVPGGIFERLGFLVLAFAPLLFLPFASRAIWMAILPLAEVLCSRMPTTFTIGSHYAGAWIGYVLAPFALKTRKMPLPRMHRMLCVAVALCVVELLVADPLHPGINLRPPGARDAQLDRFLSTLPRDADVATQEEAYTHLALFDPRATLFPERGQTPVRACFALVDAAYPDSPRLQEYGSALQRLVSARRYVIARHDGPITLYRRSSMPGAPSACAPASRAR
jgi:uncharacterized membrane protein